jgi:hypothetical protein
VKPTPKAGNKPSPHSIVRGLDKPGSSATVSIFIGKTEIPSFTSYDDVIKNRDSKQPIREAYPIVKTKKSEN